MGHKAVLTATIMKRAREFQRQMYLNYNLAKAPLTPHFMVDKTETK